MRGIFSGRCSGTGRVGCCVRALRPAEFVCFLKGAGLESPWESDLMAGVRIERSAVEKRVEVAATVFRLARWGWFCRGKRVAVLKLLIVRGDDLTAAFENLFFRTCNACRAVFSRLVVDSCNRLLARGPRFDTEGLAIGVQADWAS